jgi:hypothetical protein
MRLIFSDYSLERLEAGLTVRHPISGWPAWIPVLGVRVWFKTLDPSSFWTSLSPAYLRFVEAFGDRLNWHKGLLAKRRSRLKAAQAIPSLPEGGTSDWDIDICGPGEEKLQAFRHSFRTAATKGPAGWIRGHVYVAVPLDCFLGRGDLVNSLIHDLSGLSGLEVGFAGLCGAGTPDYQSSWRDPEFFSLLNYWGIDPSEDGGIDGERTAWDGYSHSAQWITMLGNGALSRLGGAEQLADRARQLSLSVVPGAGALCIRAGGQPDAGFRRLPALYRSVDQLLKPNMGQSYFMGHGFNAYGAALFGDRGPLTASDLWMRRFESESVWSSALQRQGAVDIGLTRSGWVEVTPVGEAP